MKPTTTRYISYRKARSEYDYTPAHVVLGWLRAQEQTEMTYGHVTTDAPFVHRGLTIVVRCEPDELYDAIREIGTFDYTNDADAVINPQRSISHRYFHPAIPLREHRDAFRAMGLSKHDAWVRARACVFEDCRTVRNNSVLMVTVTATLTDIPFAHDALSGVLVADSDDPYLREIVIDMLEDVCDLAYKKLDRLYNAYKRIPRVIREDV